MNTVRIAAKELDKNLGTEALYSRVRNVVEPRVIAFINNRVKAGNFLGGKLANKGYSTNPLPSFFFGSTQYNRSSKGITVDPPSIGRAVFSESQIFWRTVNGSAMSFVEGGYKAFRQATGRTTSTVNLTLSGRMLMGLDGITRRGTNEIVTKIGIYNEAKLYAGRVNEQREFLGLTDSEEQMIVKMLQG